MKSGYDLVSKFEAEYDAKYGELWSFGTRPYQSTLTLWAAVEYTDAFGAFVYSRLRFPKQTAVAFNYGSGNSYLLTPDLRGLASAVETDATDADTNLARSLQTNSGEDVVITGIGLARRRNRVRVAAEADPQGSVASPLASSVGVAVCDPAFRVAGNIGMGSVLPPMWGSTVFNTDPLYDALLNQCSFRLRYGKNRIEDFGRAALFPPAGGAAIQGSNGIPDPLHGFEIPEGLAWTASGERSQLQAELVVDREVVMQMGEAVRATGVGTDSVVSVYVDIAVVLRCIAFRKPDVRAGGLAAA